MSNSLALPGTNALAVMPRAGLMASAAPIATPAAGPTIIGYTDDREALLTKLVRWFEAAEMDGAEAQRERERAWDYYHGKQWTAEELEALRKRGQPPAFVNHVREKVDVMRGMESQGRTDPKAVPRTPMEDDRANAATQALRFVADDNDFNAKRSDFYRDMLISGFGALEIKVVPGMGADVKVKITQVPADQLFHDPHSRCDDFSDASHLGVVIWMGADEAEERYPGARDLLADMPVVGSYYGGGGGYEDRPVNAWCDNRRTRVRVVQMHWRERDEWWAVTFTRGGFLVEPHRSPYLDREGRSTCPLVLQSAYVDRDNSRYGIVRDLFPLQDGINKRHSKMLHNISVNRIEYEDGAIEDIDETARQAARPDGRIKINPGMSDKVRIVNNADLSVGQMELLRYTTAEMQAKGANANLAGKDPRELSGRAILAQQAGGQVAIEPMADALRRCTRRVLERAYCCVQQYWPKEKSLRVMDDNDKASFITMNHDVTLAEELSELPDDKRAQVMQQMMIVPNDPRLATVIRTDNSLADLDVDITIESTPPTASMQAEQFTQFMQVLPALGPGAVPPEVIIRMMPGLKDKDALIAAMKAAHAAPPAPPPEVVAMQHAKIAETQSKAALNQATANERQAGAAERVHGIVVHHAAMTPQAPTAYAPPGYTQPPVTYQPGA